MNWCVHFVQVFFSGNPQPNQPAVKVRHFYMVKLQCPCPISLWTEPGLNVPILILPDKLNQGIGRGAGESHPVKHIPALPSLPAKRSGHLERRVVNWFRMWEVCLTSTPRHTVMRETSGQKILPVNPTTQDTVYNEGENEVDRAHPHSSSSLTFNVKVMIKSLSSDAIKWNNK